MTVGRDRKGTKVKIPVQPTAPVALWRKVTAFAIAGAADLMQVTLLPIFAPVALPPINNIIDVIVGVILTLLLGWHWVFLPSFIAEMVPGLDLAPTWTLAVTWAVLRRPTAAPPVRKT